VIALGGDDAPDATPLTPEDVEGLRPTWVSNRTQLNECEQQNIQAAMRWAFSTRGRRPVKDVSDLLTIGFSDLLHRRMFGDVWTWAGARRRRMTNIGVDPADINVSMKLLFDDAQYWHDNGVFPPHEIAARIHHRLVCIHPYINGNGRQTRMMADLYLHLCKAPPLTWGGQAILTDAGPARARYIASLRTATAGDISDLLSFATD
jgi:Fic-DOC domain mobile mystery protein B